MRFLLWFVVFAGFIYGGYFVYDRWFDGSPVLSRGAPSDIFEYLRKKTSTEMSLVKDRYIDEPVKGAVSGVTNQALASFKSGAQSALEQASDALSRVAVSFNATSSEVMSATSSVIGGVGPSLPARIVLASNDVFKLRVSASDSDAAIVIGWGDGKREAISLDSGETRLVSHVFPQSGEYEVVITSDASGTRGMTTFLISVTK